MAPSAQVSSAYSALVQELRAQCRQLQQTVSDRASSEETNDEDETPLEFLWTVLLEQAMRENELLVKLLQAIATDRTMDGQANMVRTESACDAG